MKKGILLMVLLLTILLLPVKVNADDWKENISCTAKESFRPNEVVTCVYKITPPKTDAASAIVGKIEVSNKLEVKKIETDEKFQGEILKNIFNFYALTKEADVKEDEFKVIKITMKLKEESNDEYVKIRDVIISNKEYQDVYLKDIDKKIKISKESIKKEEKKDIKNAALNKKEDKEVKTTTTSTKIKETSKNETSKNIKETKINKKIEKEDKKSSIVILLLIVGIILITILIRKFKKTSE